jgi:hypothetical protein
MTRRFDTFVISRVKRLDSRDRALVSSCMPPLDDAERSRQYHAISDAFLALGPRFPEVATRAGTDAQTVQNVWNRGISALGLPPISTTYQKHLIARRTALHRGNGSAASTGAADAVCLVSAVQETAADVPGQEADILAAFRHNVSSALGLSSQILVALRRVAVKVADRIATNLEESPHVGMETLLGPLETLSKSTAALSTATKQVFEMQRLLVGAPQQITEHRTSEESQEKIKMLLRVAEMMRDNRLDASAPERRVIDAVPYEGEESNASPPVAMTTSGTKAA